MYLCSQDIFGNWLYVLQVAAFLAIGLLVLSLAICGISHYVAFRSGLVLTRKDVRQFEGLYTVPRPAGDSKA